MFIQIFLIKLYLLNVSANKEIEQNIDINNNNNEHTYKLLVAYTTLI